MDNKLKILSYLGKNLRKQFTMHALSKAVQIPYATLYRNMQEIRTLVTIELAGKAKMVSLQTQNSIIKSYLAVASEEEKEEYLNSQPLIKKIANELTTSDMVLLFGSYAKRTQRETSDIDLLIINQKGNKTASFSKYEVLFQKKYSLFLSP